MKYILSLLFLSAILISWQQKEKTTITDQSISAETDKIYHKLVKIRRDFMQILSLLAMKSVHRK